MSKRLVNLLASVKFAVTVVIILAVACVAGTLVPQGTEVAQYVGKHPAAAARLELFGRLGLTHVFASWWFIGLLCTLAATTAVCSTRRFSTVLRTAGFARRRALGSMLTHISILLILTGGVIRGVWGQKGYLEFREGEQVAQFMTETGARPLPFALQLAKFEIEGYDQKEPIVQDGLFVIAPAENRQKLLPVEVGVEQSFDDFKITVLKYIPDFVLDTATREVTTRSAEPRNPAILVAVTGPTYRNHRWLFAKFPDYSMPAKDSPATGPSPLQLVFAAQLKRMPPGPIKSFRSTVRLPNGERVVEVNRPLRYGGYTFYQSGYNPRDLAYTSLEVVKDPGVPVVYAGFGLMLGGLFIVFYLNPWLDNRRKAA